MSVVTATELKFHMNLDSETGLGHFINPAEEFVGSFIGKALSEFDPLPDALKIAVKMLAAHLYENREATIVGVDINLISPGIYDLMAPYREYVF